MVMATQLGKDIDTQLGTALPKRNSMMGKLHFKKTTFIPDEVVDDYNPSIWEAGAGGFLRVQGPICGITMSTRSVKITQQGSVSIKKERKLKDKGGNERRKEKKATYYKA